MDSNDETTWGRFESPFLILHPFMWEDFSLHGIDLLVYARIFGFCKDGGLFYESRARTASYLGVSERSIVRSIGGLEAIGLIVEVPTEDARCGMTTRSYSLGRIPQTLTNCHTDKTSPPDNLAKKSRSKDDELSCEGVPTWHLKSKDKSKD